MTRREFRLISGAGRSPTIEDITKRKSSRRHFKTLHVGGVTNPPRFLHAITIKGIDKTDGVTIWEYGPGSYWRHHYGADAISGVVPDLGATLDKYATAAGIYPAYNPCGNRNTATLTANAAEGLTVTKLDSLDGTVIESATLTGFFCDDVGTTYVSLMSGLSISNAAALSGGDYVIVGERVPFIEFVDFADNTVNKEYILHAHGQQNGNVYLQTRTSSEVITIPQDSTAGEVETLFEATSDCVAATATGGPWPLVPIAIDVEWSVSSGDISGISRTGSYTATGSFGVGHEVSYEEIDPSIEALHVDVSAVRIGEEWSFEFAGGGGDPFEYTVATESIASFLSSISAAMWAFAVAEGADGYWESVASDAGNVAVSGTRLTVMYGVGVTGRLFLTVTPPPPIEDTRLSGCCAASYDTGTGDMVSAVGYEFGLSKVRSLFAMFSESAANPTLTGLNVLGILGIGSGPSNSIVATPAIRNNGDLIKASEIESWTISAGLWEMDWQKWCNATMSMPEVIQVESGYVLCSIAAKRFDGVNDRTAAKILISDGTVTEVMTTYDSITAPDNQMSTRMYDDTPGSYFSWAYQVTYEDSVPGDNSYTINDHGADTWVDGDELRLGAIPFAADATQIYATQARSVTSWRYDAIGDNTDDELFIKFLASHTSRAAEPQQFRFILPDMPGTNYTSWLDWYATDAEMETALDALLGSGNCSFIDFGLDPTPVVNSPVALIEFNPLFRFYTDQGYTPGSGRIPSSYFDFRNDGALRGGVEIEMQTLTPFTDPTGISAYDVADGTLIWSRAFGTSLVGSFTVAWPTHMWLQGDFVYAYGPLLENELP